MPVANRIEDAALTAVAVAIAADIAVRFGHEVNPSPEEATESRGTHSLTLGIEQSLGIFDMVVTEACVKLRAEAAEDGSIWVQGALHYEHVSLGRNGSNIGTWWVRDGDVMQFRAG